MECCKHSRHIHLLIKVCTWKVAHIGAWYVKLSITVFMDCLKCSCCKNAVNQCVYMECCKHTWYVQLSIKVSSWNVTNAHVVNKLSIKVCTWDSWNVADACVVTIKLSIKVCTWNGAFFLFKSFSVFFVFCLFACLFVRVSVCLFVCFPYILKLCFAHSLVRRIHFKHLRNSRRICKKMVVDIRIVQV